MEEEYTALNTKDISYDIENPRIKKALEKYGDNIDPERIYFALRSATEGQKSSASFSALKDSICASRGVVVPITVILRNSHYVCIDGNTRLAIYKKLYKEDNDENWLNIKSVIINNAKQRDIEKIRVTAHLVGAREWPAYEKACYLHYLRHQEFMDYGEIIQLCGGNKKEIERQIDAYHDMNEYYRDVVDDPAFHIDRFSGFVELQKPGIKEAIFEAGLQLEDFGEWIKTGMIRRLETVRKLKKVLGDQEAKKIFLEGGPASIDEAIQTLEQRRRQEQGESDKKMTLESASLSRLVDTLTERINNITFQDICELKDKKDEETSDQIASFGSLSACLQRLLDDVSE